ncbi:hypothetical protein KDA11_04990, partial [Candidatus Saccharibacteria bacterium]|nr:hypothetical protein [Candidatus Saccharibacteria bacterium]
GHCQVVYISGMVIKFEVFGINPIAACGKNKKLLLQERNAKLIAPKQCTSEVLTVNDTISKALTDFEDVKKQKDVELKLNTILLMAYVLQHDLGNIRIKGRPDSLCPEDIVAEVTQSSCGIDRTTTFEIVTGQNETTEVGFVKYAIGAYIKDFINQTV